MKHLKPLNGVKFASPLKALRRLKRFERLKPLKGVKIAACHP